MISWLKRAAQTRTRVDNAAAMDKERREGLHLAQRNLCAILLAVQLLLWLALYCYDRQRQSSWQSALLALLPLGVLAVLWYYAAKKGPLAGGRAFAGLLLIPCLWLDVFFCMAGCVSLLEYYIPSFPFYGRLLMVTVFPLATAWLSRSRGIAYGLYPLKYFLLIAFALSTVLSGADVSPARLQPLAVLPLPAMGQGLYAAAGAVWPVCLLFLLPGMQGPEGKSRRWIFLLIPVALMLIWALWMCMLRPWQPGDALVPAQKLTAISQYSGNMIMSQLGTLLWTTALPAAILGSVYAACRLLAAALPRCPSAFFPAVVILPAAALLLLPAQTLTRWMDILLPLRWVPALAAGLLLLLMPGKER
ncbi:MAG: hypothetical protein E7331_09820 [Clostridiales bacterium]|nr:hypothetical protein [Clostridiales bacterium]